MATATKSRRSVSSTKASKTTKRTGPRYLVIAGRPWSANGVYALDSETDMPEEGMTEMETVGSYATVEEAVAECGRINYVHLLTRTSHVVWAIIVVDVDGTHGE